MISILDHSTKQMLHFSNNTNHIHKRHFYEHYQLDKHAVDLQFYLLDYCIKLFVFHTVFNLQLSQSKRIKTNHQLVFILL